MSFADDLKAHQRLIILRKLADTPCYKANDSFLQGVLDTFGLPAGRQHVRELIEWLEQAEPPLVTVDRPGGADGSLVPTLTQDGMDVARGRVEIEGVQRPGPGTVGSAALRAAVRIATDRLKPGEG